MNLLLISTLILYQHTIAKVLHSIDSFSVTSSRFASLGHYIVIPTQVLLCILIRIYHYINMSELLVELKNNEVFRVYAFWSGVLVVKMLAMSVLTSLTRFRTKVNFLTFCFFFYKLLCHFWLCNVFEFGEHEL